MEAVQIKKTKGDETKTAELLGAHRNTIIRKINSLRHSTVANPRIESTIEVTRISKLLGKKIREGRKESGISQVQLTKKSKVNRTTLCYAEIGIINITPETINKIAKVLEIPDSMIKTLLRELKEKIRNAEERKNEISD